jgi:hypothetical protein
MYCSLGQNQFFDDAGAPLSAGRVKIYAKGSDTLLPIYEDNGDGFVPAQNPVITANDGRIPTVFWPAALVDVVVEKSNGDGTYTELDSYVAGLDLASVEAVQGVGSITELRSIMPSENMVVQVNGYYMAGDSPTRKYLWVAGAANTDDGGYVIRSNSDNGGRWVMLWDDPEFLPVSLYGVMCGYSGYAKTSNIPALETLGHYVIVGGVRVEVPPVILFDWRMAQPTSGQSSPVAYHWSGTFTTTHYVACARGVVFSTAGKPTIHCAGVRGESYATAYWMVDQNYTDNDPAEKISTLMFKGNTSTMHDAFMDCAACTKVKVVELSQDGSGTTLYDLLGIGDSFAQKIVIDYTSILAVQYSTGGCVWIQPYLGKVHISGLKVNGISASSGTFGSDVLTDLLTVTTRARVGGGNTQGGSDVALDVGKLAKFLHTEFHAPLRLQYNGSQESPGRTPVVQVTSGTVFDLTVSPYSSYLDGECLRIVNMGGSTLTINGTASTDSIPPYRFGDVFRWNGVWYMER